MPLGPAARVVRARPGGPCTPACSFCCPHQGRLVVSFPRRLIYYYIHIYIYHGHRPPPPPRPPSLTVGTVGAGHDHPRPRGAAHLCDALVVCRDHHGIQLLGLASLPAPAWAATYGQAASHLFNRCNAGPRPGASGGACSTHHAHLHQLASTHRSCMLQPTPSLHIALLILQRLHPTLLMQPSPGAAPPKRPAHLLIGAQDHGFAQDGHQRLAREAGRLVARRQHANLEGIGGWRGAVQRQRRWGDATGRQARRSLTLRFLDHKTAADLAPVHRKRHTDCASPSPPVFCAATSSVST